MAVITTSFLAAVECDCCRAILACHSPVGHRDLRRVLDAQHSAERQLHPALRKSRCIAARIRWISKGHIVSERLELLREGERQLSVDGREIGGAQRLDVLLQGAKALGIFFYEISRNRSAR